MRKLLAALLFWPGLALAQGMDSTIPERDTLVIAEMLPGIYDNREQVYFNRRTGVREEARHEPLHSVIERVEVPALGDFVFFVQDSRDGKLDDPYRLRLYSFWPDNEAGAVRMRIWYITGVDRNPDYIDAYKAPEKLAGLTEDDLTYLEGCDVFWRRQASQFHAAMADKTCQWEWPGKGDVWTDYQIQLSYKALWTRDLTLNEQGDQFTGNIDQVFYQMNRARKFQCYADLPGVSGGRDVEFNRYGPYDTHDQGGTLLFDTKEGRKVSATIRNVDWRINNENEGFTRDSLVMYLVESKEDGSSEFHGYVFTQPDAERIAMNLGWILVNCFTTFNRSVTPEF